MLGVHDARRIRRNTRRDLTRPDCRRYRPRWCIDRRADCQDSDKRQATAWKAKTRARRFRERLNRDVAGFSVKPRLPRRIGPLVEALDLAVVDPPGE